MTNPNGSSPPAPSVTFAPKLSKGSFKKKKKANGLESRPWQTKCAKKLRGVRFANVSAPCGAGKTVALIILAAQELADSHLTQKQLIIAPQRVIGDAFTETRTVKVDGTPYTWAPQLNNFVNYKQQRVIRALRRWLLQDSTTLLKNVGDSYKLDETVAITSHQALAIVWRKLTKSQKAQALKALTITVDEAHHVSGVFDENGSTTLSKDEQDEANHLGQVIQAAIHAGKTTHVRLATATFYRGDSQPILDKTVAAEFAKGTFILSWIEHWDSLGLDSFRIYYRSYDSNPIPATLKQVGDDFNHHFMIFVPPSNLGFRKNNSKWLKALFAGLRELFGEDAVLDLVTQGNQQDINVRRLRADVANIKAGNKPTFKAIVSCAIGLEGMDYVPVDRLINLAVQNSIVRAIQVMGRPMRQFAGKHKVEITNYIPAYLQLGDGVSLADALADRTNRILVCLAWDDITHPIIIKLIALPKSKKSKTSKAKTTDLIESLGSAYGKILLKVLTAVEHLPNKTNAAVLAVVTAILAKAGFHDAALIEGMVVAVRRAQLKAQGSPKAQKLVELINIAKMRKDGLNILKEFKLEDQTIFFADCSKAELTVVREYLNGGEWQEVLAQAVAAKKAGKL